MKMPMLLVFLYAALLQAANAARGRLMRSQMETQEHAMGKTGFHATIRSMVGAMIEGKGPSTKDIVSSVSSKMEIGEAVKQLDGKLPADIASLVRVTTNQSEHSPQPTYDDESLQKARRYLNDMMEQGWKELDDVVFECMDFRLRNRGTYEQVVNDLSRLGSQLAELNQKKLAAINGQEEQDRLHNEAVLTREKAIQEYGATFKANDAEMTIRKNDLAVFDFMLRLTSCNYKQPSDTPSLLQKGKAKPHMQVCNGTSGIHLHFDDPLLQAKLESMMTPEARRALHAALGQTVGHMSLLQQSAVDSPDILPVAEDPHPDGQWKKCVDGPVACGMLHDLMSLEWGKFRDSFDELTDEMTHNKDEFDTLKSNINDQLVVIGNKKTEFMEAEAAAISAYNQDTEEFGEKEEQKQTLTDEFDKKCEEFRAKISEILHTKICAVRKVRNELMSQDGVSTPLSSISDCDFTDWHSLNGRCKNTQDLRITCDDSCNVNVPFDEYDPDQCGGKEVMRRDVVVSPNDYGMRCPPMRRLRRCGQMLCPVDCEVSQWSDWSKCSKDCEGGVKTRTRSILRKAKNGGMICDTPIDERSCNWGSCDRNCALEEWSAPSPCSQACDGGFTTITRGVLVPIRGQGWCPGKDTWARKRTSACNSLACQGDEVCIAKQDLIIALDASGSLREEGFLTLREFTVNLTKRYKQHYFGSAHVQMGAVLFGNGELTTEADGTTSISEALPVSDLTGHISEVRTKLEGTTYQRGFTNMAQALSMAEVMLQRGRPEAQSAVLVLSDGKYSFKYQTAEKAQEMKDKNIQIFMAPVIEYEDKEVKLLRAWASRPWQTNYVHIPGIEDLKSNQEIFVQKLIVMFCPDAYSPARGRKMDEEREFLMIREGGWPSDWVCCGYKWMGFHATVQSCADAVRSEGAAGFSYGSKRSAKGLCFIEYFQITDEQWNIILGNRETPDVDVCPMEHGWLPTDLYDTWSWRPGSVGKMQLTEQLY